MPVLFCLKTRGGGWPNANALISLTMNSYDILALDFNFNSFTLTRKIQFNFSDLIIYRVTNDHCVLGLDYKLSLEFLC